MVPAGESHNPRFFVRQFDSVQEDVADEERPFLAGTVILEPDDQEDILLSWAGFLREGVISQAVLPGVAITRLSDVDIVLDESDAYGPVTCHYLFHR